MWPEDIIAIGALALFCACVLVWGSYMQWG
jgi:hypothetical protein